MEQAIFNVFSFLGGLAFFLYGMNVMSAGLEKVAGGKLESTLKKMTSNRFKTLSLGMIITMVIQSSSAMTVMLVGLVNSGIMNFGQTIGIIMGSNIGTTITAWILSLAGLEGDNFFVKLLKPDTFAPILAFIGIALFMFSNKEKKKEAGKILVGFGILMFGMSVMSDAVSPLKDSDAFTNILIAFKNPLLGVLVGAVFTGIIQSSSASVGILQALSMTGQISYGMAIPIIMGQNIGTCITALISSIGVNKNAKKVAAVHVTFNLIGTFVFLILFYVLDLIIGFQFKNISIDPFSIAIVHTIFNIATTILLLPFSKQLEAFANKIIKENRNEMIELLDERLISTPSIALLRCRELTVDMALLAHESLISAFSIIDDYDEMIADKIEENENKTDFYEDKLGAYLVKLSRKSLSVEESHTSATLLNCIGDFERISDHACNLVKSAEEIKQKGIIFSDNAKNELKRMQDAVTEIVNITTEAFSNNDTSLAKHIEPLEEVIDKMRQSLKNAHILRLQKGECTIETGFVFNDIITNYERISDHCSNIGACIIRRDFDNMETHKYLSNVKSHLNSDFESLYKDYKSKYKIQ